jgi:methylated-DNA-protein-cysteine methyltransferase-like protein
MNKRCISIPSEFTNKIIHLIKSIPKGKVLTYGRIAKLAGNPRAARQVAWALNSSTEKYDLPWHRVINSKGLVALKSEEGRNQQKFLLIKEGVEFIDEFKIDLNVYLWKINSIEEIGR